MSLSQTPTATHTHSHKPPSLLSLPCEIRILIFCHLFIHALIQYKPGEPAILHRNRNLAILTTNRQLHLESRPILEQRTRLLIHGPLEPDLYTLNRLTPPWLRMGLKLLKLLYPTSCVYCPARDVTATTQMQMPTHPLDTGGSWISHGLLLLLPSPSSLIAVFPTLETLHLYDYVYLDPQAPHDRDALQALDNAALLKLIGSNLCGIFKAVASHFIDKAPQRRYKVLASVQTRCESDAEGSARLTALVDVDGWKVLRKGVEDSGDASPETAALLDGF